MISVAMASYNGKEYITKQLESIFHQTRKVDEIVIVDDCSTDGTAALIEGLQKEHKEIVLYRNEENLGYKRNFKKACSLCHGDYIFLCDQDDLWVDEKVEVMMSIMENRPDIMALASSFDVINGNDETQKVEVLKGFSNNNFLRREVPENVLTKITFEELTIQNSFQGCALVITKEMSELFQKCFTEELFHDWLINLLAASRDGMYYINRVLFHYRIHGDNTIGITPPETFSGIEHLVKTNRLHIRTLFAENIIHVLKILESVDPDLKKFQPDYEDKIDFYQNHIEYLSKGNITKLIAQNKTPYYKQIKRLRARVMDVYFAVRQKVRAED